MFIFAMGWMYLPWNLAIRLGLAATHDISPTSRRLVERDAFVGMPFGVSHKNYVSRRAFSHATHILFCVLATWVSSHGFAAATESRAKSETLGGLVLQLRNRANATEEDGMRLAHALQSLTQFRK